MDERSPFASFGHSKEMSPTREIHVLFCQICHYIWKGPAETNQCINCTNQATAISLVKYQTEVPIT